MKTLKQIAAVLSLAALLSPFAQAQDQSKSKDGEGRRGRGSPGAQGEGRGQMMNPEARVEQLHRAVNLTDDQKAKVKEIYTKAQEQMRAAMRDGSGDREAAREKMMGMMRATRDEVRAVLTDEQKKKFDEMTPPRGGGERGGDRGGKGGERSKGGRGEKK